MSRLDIRLVTLFSIVFFEVTATGAPPTDPLPRGAVVRFGSLRFQHESIGRTVAISRDGKFLATSGANNPICVWNAATGEVVRTHASFGGVYDLQLTAEGKLVALTSFGHNGLLMQQWGVDSSLSQKKWEELRREADLATDEKRFLSSRILSHDGRRVVAVWSDSSEKNILAKVFRFNANAAIVLEKPEREIALKRGDGHWLSHDGKWFLSHESTLNRLVAFDLNAAPDSNEPVWHLDFPPREVSRYADRCLTADGKNVVIHFRDGSLELWDGPAKKLLRVLPKANLFVFAGGGESPAIDLSSDGKRIVHVTRNANGQINGRIIGLDSDRDDVTFDEVPLPGIGSARFSGDGSRVVVSSGGAVRVWDAKTGKEVLPLPGHRGPANSVVVSLDGKTAITAGSDLTVRAWDPVTGTERWKAQFAQRVAVRFVSKDTVVVKEWYIGSAPAEQLIDLATGRVRALPGEMSKKHEMKTKYGGYFLQETLLAISPDNTTAITLNPQTPSVCVWSWPGGELKKIIPIEVPKEFRIGHCRSAYFTDDGKDFVTMFLFDPREPKQGSRSGPDHHPFIDRFDIQSGQRVKRTDCGLGTDPILVGNGKQLMLVKGPVVSDAITGFEVAKLNSSEARMHSRYHRGADLSPDGKTLAIAPEWAGDGFLYQVDLESGKVRAKYDTKSISRHEVAYLPDGKLITVGNDVLVWDKAPTKP